MIKKKHIRFSDIWVAMLRIDNKMKIVSASRFARRLKQI